MENKGIKSERVFGGVCCGGVLERKQTYLKCHECGKTIGLVDNRSNNN